MNVRLPRRMVVIAIAGLLCLLIGVAWDELARSCVPTWAVWAAIERQKYERKLGTPLRDPWGSPLLVLRSSPVEYYSSGPNCRDDNLNVDDVLVTYRIATGLDVPASTVLLLSIPRLLLAVAAGALGGAICMVVGASVGRKGSLVVFLVSLGAIGWSLWPTYRCATYTHLAKIYAYPRACVVLVGIAMALMFWGTFCSWCLSVHVWRIWFARMSQGES